MHSFLPPAGADMYGQHIRSRFKVINAAGLTSIVCALLLCAADVQGQVTVQLPNVQTFNVNTSVSVPDRGSVLLGGVSSARDSRFTPGFSPFGSSIGTERNASSMRATVTIHDFEEMEAELARQAEAIRYQLQVRTNTVPLKNPNAERAYLSLMRRAGQPDDSATPAPSPLQRVIVDLDPQRSDRSTTRLPPASPVNRIWNQQAITRGAAQSRTGR